MNMKIATVRQEYLIRKRHMAQNPLEPREAGSLAYLDRSCFGGQHRAMLRAGQAARSATRRIPAPMRSSVRWLAYAAQIWRNSWQTVSASCSAHIAGAWKVTGAGADSAQILHHHYHRQRTMAAGKPPRNALVCDKVMS
jgi:hypothetical protein